MIISLKQIRRIRRSWPILALCAFYIYLAFHALSGSQGLMSWVDYQSDINAYKKELIELEAIQDDLQFQIDGLRADSLNADLFDQKVREKAFLSQANEMTIWLDPKD